MDRQTVSEYRIERLEMVFAQVEPRGVRDAMVLRTMRQIPREAFVPHFLQASAYRDQPLMLEDGLSLPQPYVAAFMAEALCLKGGERALLIGAGSGYMAALIGSIVGDVYVIEPIGRRANKANAILQELGFDNIHMQHSSDPEAWIDRATFDAILVAERANVDLQTLEHQLARDGRLVMVTGEDERTENLIRIQRRIDGTLTREELADVRFVPAIDGEPFTIDGSEPVEQPQDKTQSTASPPALVDLIAKHAQEFNSVDEIDLDKLLTRIGDRRVVLLGEASHGTAEFHDIRTAITRRLIVEKGFNIIALEADWPDAARIDHFVRQRDVPACEWQAFSRFPTWMWRNESVARLVSWLHEHNTGMPYESRAACYGLDLYSLHLSANAVVDYLDDVDPELAMVARHRYGCLGPWEEDPAAYGQAATTGNYRRCESGVVKMLVDLYQGRSNYLFHDGDRFLDAGQNARLVVDAERYYRIMYYGSRAAWNLRDGHMFDTLQDVLDHHGESSKVVVWAHNSHIGDAAATEMGLRGEYNLGELCRKGFGSDCYRIGFGTHEGTVAAASAWGGELEIKTIQQSHPESYEWLCHQTGMPGFILPLGAASHPDLHEGLMTPRLERAIGVIYHPDSELASHYFKAELPRQFDDYIWIDKTSAVVPLSAVLAEGVPDTYPFGI